MSEPKANPLMERRGSIAILRLSNPPANTWTPESLAHLMELLAELERDADNRALVMIGEGDKFFSAGADLKRFNHDDKGRAFAFASLFGDAFKALANYGGLSIAAINGYAMGGGLEAALACDVRLAAPGAQLALPECTVGLLPAGLGTQHLPWLVGEQWAKRMIMLGERLDAARALQIGLVSEVVEGDILARALELAGQAQGQSPDAARRCKQLIMAARRQSLDSAAAAEREHFVRLWDNPNRAEGVGAFLEKRKPQWRHD